MEKLQQEYLYKRNPDNDDWIPSRAFTIVKGYFFTEEELKTLLRNCYEECRIDMFDGFMGEQGFKAFMKKIF